MDLRSWKIQLLSFLALQMLKSRVHSMLVFAEAGARGHGQCCSSNYCSETDLTLKAPITTAADDIHIYFFIVCQRK